MDAASGIVGVLSLGFQITQSLHKAKMFLKDIKDAPEELQRILNTLELLDQVLNDVTTVLERQRDMKSSYGSVPHISSSLQACKLSVENLEAFLRPLHMMPNCSGGFRKAKTVVRLVLKKEEIKRLNTRIYEHFWILQTVVIVNINHMQYASLRSANDM